MAEKPIVYTMVLNPRAVVGVDQNITGVHLESSPRKSLETMRRLLPNISRVGVVYNPSLNEENMNEAHKIAKSMNVELVSISCKNIGEAIKAIPSLADRVDIMWMIPDAVTASSKVFEMMLATSLKRGVPLFALSRKHVSQGALAALSADYYENGRQAGRMASRIARGKSPSSIADEYSFKSRLVINLNTAKTLGLDLNQQIISEAAEIYKR